MKVNFDEFQAVIDEQSHEEYEDVSVEEQDIDAMFSEENLSEADVDELQKVHAEATATHSAVLPKDVFVPEWLKRSISDVKVPAIITKGFLIDLGSNLLRDKIADVEEYNMAGLGNKKRIPDKLDFDEVAVVTMSIFTFKLIQLTDRATDRILSVYCDDPADKNYGTYVHDRGFLFELLERIAPKYKKRDMEDVIDKIKRSAGLVQPSTDKNLFAVNNGVFNKETRELLPFDKEYVFIKKIPVDYNEDAQNVKITAADGYVWDVESWIKDLMDDDEDSTTLIWQVIADSLQANHSMGKSVWFYSEKGNNGKGTIGQLIKNLVGKGNYSKLSVVDFKHEYFKGELLNATVNIADENDVNIYIDSVKDYKASITGDDIMINRKYEDTISIQFRGANIQMLNGLPKTADGTDSLYRRLVLVPFLKSFTNNGERTYIKSDYIARKEVLEYVLYKALNMDFEEYIVPLRSAELLSDYKQINNTVLEFWNEYKDQFVWDLLPANFLYSGYKNYLKEANPSSKPMSRNTFMERLAAVVAEDGEWERVGRQRSKNRMDGDEPLITEFKLDRAGFDGYNTEWVNPAADGSNLQKRRDFVRSEKYAGLLRL